MARIRSVHPGLTSDEAFMTMSMTAKAAWPLLWTECDDGGVFEWKPVVLKARLFPADSVDFAAVLAEFEALDCIKQVEIGGKLYGLVRNFGKYQRPKNPSYRVAIPDEHLLYVGRSGIPTPALPQPSTSPTEKPSQMEDGEGEGEGKKERGVDARASAADPQSGIDEKQKPKRIDPDWQPSPALRTEAQGLGLTPDQIDRAASRFRAHHVGSGTKRADWGPLFVSWCADDAAKGRASKPVPVTMTPAPAIWIVEGSEAWAVATKARGKPPVKTYRAGDAGAWVRPDEIGNQAGAA
jgi:hypothetical protein